MRNYILTGRLKAGVTSIAQQIFTHIESDSATDVRSVELEAAAIRILAGHSASIAWKILNRMKSDSTTDVRSADDVFEVADAPNETKSLIKIPIGSPETQDTEEFTLFDTPSLSSDNPKLENTARVALGLPQEGPAEHRISEMSIVTLGNPDTEDLGDLDAIDAYLNRRHLGCIYVLNAAETPFEVEIIKAQIEALREIYWSRFFIVVTQEDLIETWPERPQERRYESIKAVTGGKYISVNGLTGDGIETLIRTLAHTNMRKREFHTLCETVENVILSYTTDPEDDPEDITPKVPPPEMTDLISGLLHRWESPTSAIIAGRTNAGKTAFIRLAYSDSAVRIRFQGAVLDVEDAPDETKSLIRIPFGSSKTQDTKGLTLFDTPGLTADTRVLGNIARVALGLPQTGEAEDRIPNEEFPGMPVAKLGLPDANGMADLEKEADFPLDRVDAFLNRENLNCIYVLSAVETPFEVEIIKAQIEELREMYQDRFFIVVTKEDIIEAWPGTERKERRYEMIQAVTGGKYTSVNGLTGYGLKKFIAEFFNKNNNHSDPNILKHFAAEVKCYTLFHASNQLSDILLAAFFSKRLQEKPNELLYPVLDFVIDLALKSIYGTTDADWQERTEESVQQFAEQLRQDFLETHHRFIEKDRKTIGIREWFKAKFTDWTPKITVEVIDEVINSPVTLLSYLYYGLYHQIYDRETAAEGKTVTDPVTREKIPDQTATTVLTGDPVPVDTAIAWFTTEFEHCQDLIQNRENAWNFYRIIGPVLARFWQAHHPEVLPVRLELDPNSKSP